MDQPDPAELQEQDEDGATRRRFAELMSRFWRRYDQAEPSDSGETR